MNRRNLLKTAAASTALVLAPRIPLVEMIQTIPAPKQNPLSQLDLLSQLMGVWRMPGESDKQLRARAIASVEAVNRSVDPRS